MAGRTGVACRGRRAVFDVRLTPAELTQFLNYTESDEAFQAAELRAERRVVQ